MIYQILSHLWKASKYNLTKGAKRKLLGPLSELCRFSFGKVVGLYKVHFATVNICEIRNRYRKLFLNIFQIHISFDIRAKVGRAGQFQFWPPLEIMFPYVPGLNGHQQT